MPCLQQNSSSMMLFLSSWGSYEPPHYCFEDYICFCWCDSSPFFFFLSPLSSEEEFPTVFFASSLHLLQQKHQLQARADRTWAHTGSTKQKIICSYPWMTNFHIYIHGFLLCMFFSAHFFTDCWQFAFEVAGLSISRCFVTFWDAKLGPVHLLKHASASLPCCASLAAE